MTYKLTILKGTSSETQETLKKHLTRISSKHRFFSKIHLISNTPPNPPTLQTSKTTTTNLWDIINNPTTTYIFAKPSDEVNINPELSFSNTFEFNQGKVKIAIHQDKFQLIPNLKNCATIKKLTQDKVGHGGNYFVKYRYLIKMDKIVPQLKQIIDIVFSEVEIVTFVPYQGEIQTDTVELVDLQDLDNYETYECLTLVANLKKQKIVQDENYSRYSIPWNNQTINKYTVFDVNSDWICQVQDWSILSLHNDTNHTLIYKTSLTTKIWEI